MSTNQPIGANTQVGILNGSDEEYAKIDELADALKPLLTDGIISSGPNAPTVEPVDGVPPFYVRTGTNPDTLYWWNPLPAPGAWALIGTVPAALLAAADWPLALPADANRPASGEFVVAAIAALKAMLDPCTVTAATAAEIAAMTANSALLRLAVCYMDGSPTPVGITGADLAAILAGGGGAGGASGTFVTSGAGGANFRKYCHPVGSSGQGNSSSITIPAGFWHIHGTAVGSTGLPISVTGTATNNMYIIDSNDNVASPTTQSFPHNPGGNAEPEFFGYVNGGDVLDFSAVGGETNFSFILTRLNP